MVGFGVHFGPVIAMTANDRLDYFGRTVNIAARLGDQSRGHDIVLLSDVFDLARAEIAAAGSGLALDAFRSRLRGLDDEQRLVRLIINQQAPAHPEYFAGRAIASARALE